MMFQTILALSLAAVVLGEEGCCSPRKWEGTQYVLGGYSKGLFRKGSIRNAFAVSYDADNQAIAVSGRYKKWGQEGNFKAIYNFLNRTGYLVLPDKDKCKTFPLKNGFREACIPDEARFLGNSYFGVGDNSLEVKAFAMDYKGTRATIGAVALVTKEGCVPVSEDVAGRYWGYSFFENVNFMGITPGIDDPNVFIPPEYCNEKYDSGEIIQEKFYEKYSMLQFTHPGVAHDQEDYDEPFEYTRKNPFIQH